MRADMVAGIAQFLDAQFIDPAVAAVAGVNPASITNGAPDRGGHHQPAGRPDGPHRPLRDQQHPGRRADGHPVAGQRAVDVVPHQPGRHADLLGHRHERRQLPRASRSSPAWRPGPTSSPCSRATSCMPTRAACRSMPAAKRRSRWTARRRRPADATTVHGLALAAQHGRPARRAVRQLEARQRQRGEVPDRGGLSRAVGRRRGAGRPRGEAERRARRA